MNYLLLVCSLFFVIFQTDCVPQPRELSKHGTKHFWKCLRNLGSFTDRIESFIQFYERVFVITKDDEVFAFGNQSRGQNMFGLGHEHDGIKVATPTEIKELKGKKIVKFASGSYHTIALSSDGTVYGWGGNSYGQLGNSLEFYIRPVVIPHLHDIIDVTCNQFSTVLLSKSNKVYTLGSNMEGELGGGNKIVQSSPVEVHFGNKTQSIISISSTFNAANVALTTNSEVYVWGEKATKTPTLLNFPKKAVRIITAMENYYLLTDEGDIYKSYEFNQLEVHRFYDDELKFKSIYADLDAPYFLVAEANDNYTYMWQDVRHGGDSLLVVLTENIPQVFAIYDVLQFLPFMVKL